MSNELKRTLDLKDSISVVAGSMIGCGIFIVSADILRQVHNVPVMMLVWIVAVLFSLFGAIAYVEPVINIKEDGGQYMFLKKMYNELVAFLYGWSLLTVIQTATVAAVCIATGKFLGIILPVVASDKFIINLPFFKFSTQQFVALSVCIFLTYVNSRGIKYGVLTQNLFTFTKVLSMAGIIIFGILFGLNYDIIAQNFSNITSSIASVPVDAAAAATVGAIFTTVTWNNITFISGEVKNPERNIPLALFWGVLGVGILYLLVNILYVSVLSVDAIQTAHEDIVAAAMMQQIAGTAGGMVIAVIIMISAFGSANGLIMTGARVYYQMAKDKLLFSKLAIAHPVSNAPVNSLVLQCIWTCAFILFCGNYSQLLDYVIYASLIFYVLTSAGIFIYRKNHKNENLKKIPSFFAAVFTLVGLFIIYSITVHKFSNSMQTIMLILAGIPVYLIWEKPKTKKDNID